MQKKKLANKLIDECIETIEETKLVNITFTEIKIIMNVVLA